MTLAHGGIIIIKALNDPERSPDQVVHTQDKMVKKIKDGKDHFLVQARRSGMDHTVSPAITPMPAFTS